MCAPEDMSYLVATRFASSWMRLALVALAACGASKPAPDDAAVGSGGNHAAGSGGHDKGGSGGKGGQGSGGVSAGTGGKSGSGGKGSGTGGGGTGGDGAGQDAAVDAGGEPDAAAPSGTPFVYASGGGPDITWFAFDLLTGVLTKKGTVAGGNNPSYLAIAPNKKTLYAVNEGDGNDSQVLAFAIDPKTAALTEINRAPSSGEGAPHLAVHPSGKWVAVAHYNSGHTSILPIRADGGVDAAVDVKRGPDDGCMKAHQAVFDASGKYLFVPCLGSNYIVQYKFDNGMLSYNDPPTVAVPGGPRHMALAPDEKYGYVLSELESLITSFNYDAAKGTLSAPETIDGYQSTPGASAHLVVHPHDPFLYVSNRAENSIGAFSTNVMGRPRLIAFETDMIDEPRDFTIDPTGRWLISANQNGAQDLLVFAIGPKVGSIMRTHVVPVGGSPQFVGVVFLP